VDRLRSALWVPVVAILATAAIVVGIGELLLMLARVEPELWGIKEPLSVIAALAIAVTILLGATWLARSGRQSRN